MINKSRFAPSPTGLLHLGNARSAAINWAFIKQIGGHFILRIDDTDSYRSTKEHETLIKEDLHWLGISWDKTFNQSDRKKIYFEKIEQLKQEKKIYPCFESPEELSLKRKSLLSSGKPPIYDRSALKLSKEEIDEKIKNGKNPHWRFKLEDKKIMWNDLVKGNILFEGNKLSDPILIREDNSLLYHLPSVIDDIEEEITHIIRGEDHISNTAFHIQLFEALNSKVPKFGHHPFLVDNKGKNLAKRLGSLSLKKLKEDGFENKTVLNYILSVGTKKNISLIKEEEDIIKNFDIKSITSSQAKYSEDILKNLNKDFIKSMEYNEIFDKIKKLNIENLDQKFWNFVRNNITFISDAKYWWELIFNEKIHETNDKEFLATASENLPEEPYDENSWGIWTKNLSIKTDRKGKELYMPIRFALTGLNYGPELKYLMPLLTKKHIIRKFGL